MGVRGTLNPEPCTMRPKHQTLCPQPEDSAHVEAIGMALDPLVWLTNLPGQWLQCHANGLNVCRVLRPIPDSNPRNRRRQEAYRAWDSPEVSGWTTSTKCPWARISLQSRWKSPTSLDWSFCTLFAGFAGRVGLCWVDTFSWSIHHHGSAFSRGATPHCCLFFVDSSILGDKWL